MDENSDLSKWTLSRPGKYDTVINLSGLAPGTYTWAIALVDVTQNNQPSLKMAVNSPEYTGEWLKVGILEIK